MPDVRIPCFPVSERSTLPDLPEMIDRWIQRYEEETGVILPAVILTPRPECKFTGHLIPVENAPEQMLVITMEPALQDASFRALEEVQKIEPSGGKLAPRKIPKFKDNTPLKSVFRQMEESAITVFSLTMAGEDGRASATTIFFLRCVHHWPLSAFGDGGRIRAGHRLNAGLGITETAQRTQRSGIGARPSGNDQRPAGELGVLAKFPPPFGGGALVASFR